MHHCLQCTQLLDARRMRCSACGITYEGRFIQPRLARLPVEQQALAERILLAGGNLKDAAAAERVSYPTLRKRVDALIAALEVLRAADQAETDRLLAEVEAGRLAPEEAARLMKGLADGP